MIITKREHACLVLHLADSALIIDPGVLSAPFVEKDLVAIVVTHEHADHVTAEHLDRLIENSNGDVTLVGPAGVAAALPDYEWTVATPSSVHTVGGFELVFSGGRHAETHPSIPTVDNLGVMINSSVFYPGDSFDIPEHSIQVLAVPVSGPWWKTSEMMDFLDEIRPRVVFPTHEGSNSERGNTLAHARIADVANRFGGRVALLQTGDTLAIE